MKILIKNSILVSMNENLNKIEKNIDILIDDGKIVKIGRNLDSLEKDMKIIDATNKVVMPGLINTHTHIPMSIFRETLDGYTLYEWLNDKIWPMEDKLKPQDAYYASYLSFLEMIRTGSTTANDMYFFTEEIIQAAKETGIRLQTTRTLQDIEGYEKGKERLKELEKLIEKYKNENSKINFNVGIHGLYTSSKKYVKECVNFAKEKNLPVHIHFCENSKEVEDIKNNYNENPVDILLKEFKDVKTVLAHCVKLNKEEIKKLSQINVSVSHCPVSNLKLGCGVAKINEMQNNNINITIGTDGQGSGSNLDLFESMKYTALLQKGINENPKLLPAYEVLKMATVNGAKALGLEDKIGNIQEGKRADIIIIDMSSIVTKPQNDIISNIVYNVKGSDVDTTIIDGNILMENKKLIKNKEKQAIEKCKEIIDRISMTQ